MCSPINSTFKTLVFTYTPGEGHLGQIMLNTSDDLVIYTTIAKIPKKNFVCVEMSVYHHQNVLNI